MVYKQLNHYNQVFIHLIMNQVDNLLITIWTYSRLYHCSQAVEYVKTFASGSKVEILDENDLMLNEELICYLQININNVIVQSFELILWNWLCCFDIFTIYEQVQWVHQIRYSPADLPKYQVWNWTAKVDFLCAKKEWNVYELQNDIWWQVHSVYTSNFFKKNAMLVKIEKKEKCNWVSFLI